MSNFFISTVWRTGLRRILALGVFALLAAIVLQSSRAGTSTKPYTATVTPTSIPAGATTQMTLRIVNGSSNQSFGSANVTAATGPRPATTSQFNLSSATPSSGTLDPTSTSTLLKLRNLNIAPGNTLTVTMNVATPCVSGTYQWALQVKQSNDFNGPPGNDFTGNQPSTTVAGSCKLAFGVQPASAAQNFKITGTPYDSTGPSVTVDAVDGLGHTITTATGSVSLSVAGGNTGCPTTFSGFSGNTSVSLISGEATFGLLKSSLTASGCQLIASATGFTSSDPSNSFDIALAGESCGGGACPEFPTVLDSGNSSVLSSSDGGTFKFMAISSLRLPDGQCDNWTNLSDNAHWHGGDVNGFVETEGRNDGTAGNKTFKNFVNQKAIQANYGANVGQQLIPICAGGQRVGPTGAPIDCHADIANPNIPAGLKGWWGESLDANGALTGVLKQATCKDDGLWWGILASFQDRNNTNFDNGPPPAGFSWDANPLVTSWSSCTSTGATDPLCPGVAGTAYREFDIFVPDPWDWRSGP